MSYFGKFYLTGPEAQQAADWIFSARMDGEEGRTVYTCMLNAAGGIEADLTVSMIQPGSGSSADPAFQVSLVTKYYFCFDKNISVLYKIFLSHLRVAGFTLRRLEERPIRTCLTSEPHCRTRGST